METWPTTSKLDLLVETKCPKLETVFNKESVNKKAEEETRYLTSKEARRTWDRWRTVTEDSTPQVFKELLNLLTRIKITCSLMPLQLIKMAWEWVYTINVEEINKDKLCSMVWEPKEADLIWTLGLKIAWDIMQWTKLKSRFQQLIAFSEAA